VTGQSLRLAAKQADVRVRRAGEVAGAAHVVMDFTEGRLASRNDPRNPWTTRNLLPFFIELDNRVFDRFSADERRNIGVHVCLGGDVDSVHSADVQSPRSESAKEVYDQLVAAAKYIDKEWLGSTDDCGFSPFSIDKKPSREAAYKLVGKYLRDDANGIPQMAYIGCIVTVALAGHLHLKITGIELEQMPQ